MKEVTLPAGKLLAPIQLDVKANSNKTLTDLRHLLQTASLLKGVISEVTKTGDVIFTTIHGKFALPQEANQKGLIKGDKIAIKVEFEDNQISAKLISLNNKSVKAPETVSLKVIELAVQSSLKEKQDVSTNLNIRPSNQTPSIKAEINYLNLSKISDKSAIYKVLAQVNNKATVDLKLVSDPTLKFSSPYQMAGEVISTEPGKQLIKTAFGILSTNNVDLPVGKKITFEIQAINNLKVDNFSVKASVEDLLFKINNDLPLLKTLSHLVANNDNKSIPSNTQVNSPATQEKQVGNLAPINQVKDNLINMLTSNNNKLSVHELLHDDSQLQNLMDATNSTNLNDLVFKINSNQIPNLQLVNLLKNVQVKDTFKKSANRTSLSNSTSEPFVRSTTQEQPSNIISRFLSSSEQKEAINKLSEDFNKLKESFNSNVYEDVNNKWFNYNIPLYNGERVEDQLISFNRQSNEYMRFIIDLNLEALGEIQLDGLIKLNSKTRNVENFDLALRFKEQLNRQIQTEIFDLFLLNQNLTNVRGGLIFEQVTEFPIKPIIQNEDDQDGLSLLLKELKSKG